MEPPTYTTLKEVKDYFLNKPKGTECNLEHNSKGDVVQDNLTRNHGIYVSLATIQPNRYHLTFDHYDPKNPGTKISQRVGNEPTWKDIKDCTEVGETAYVVMNPRGLRAAIAQHWGGGSGVGVAKIEKNGDGWNVTRLK